MAVNDNVGVIHAVLQKLKHPSQELDIKDFWSELHQA
jgi:hypothetical protein